MMPNTVALTAFERLLCASSNRFGTALLLLVAWVTAGDGEISSEERQEMNEIARSGAHEREVDTLLAVANRGDIDEIQLACEVVRKGISDELSKRMAFLEMLIGVALADGYLRTPEAYILRFIADVIQLDAQHLGRAFKQITGKPFPQPGNLSSAQWWGTRSPGSTQSSGTAPPNVRRLKALALLGLDEGATVAEIKSAFRRMSQVHHPDRFAALGAEAVAAASATFRRIKEAFDYLTQNA